MLIKPRARFLTSANNHGHRRLNVSDQTGLCVFSLKHLKVFTHQADRGLAVAGERQIGVLTCVVILSSITINPTHLLPANHFFFFKKTLHSTLEGRCYCYRHLRCRTAVFPFTRYTHTQTFPSDVSSAQSVKPQMKRLAHGDS